MVQYIGVTQCKCICALILQCDLLIEYEPIHFG